MLSSTFHRKSCFDYNPKIVSKNTPRIAIKFKPASVLNLEKNSRGHKSFDGISALFDVGDAYYNYIDKQKLMKKSKKRKKWVSKEKKWRTPAERVKIKLKLGDRYQLLNLIKIAYAED